MAIPVWRVIPTRTPDVHRWCSRCDTRTPFRSSDRFRVNAHKRRLDVWLIYRCGRCEQTWNLPVFERTAADVIGAGLLDRLHGNHRDTAWQIAFDGPRLSRLGVDVDLATPVRVEREPLAAGPIELALAYPCRVRLERLLATELGLSRARLRALARAGALGVDPRDLRRPARHGQIIRVP